MRQQRETVKVKQDPKVKPCTNGGIMTHPCAAVVLLAIVSAVSAQEKEVCHGTSNKLSLLGSPKEHYGAIKRIFMNCKVILGNLELTHLEEGVNLSFLETIEEVSGYVLIALNTVEVIPLNNLKIIRGAKLYDKYALVVILNYEIQGERGKTHGLQELRLNSLAEILNGGVSFVNNPVLCYLNTIQWHDIVDLTAEKSKRPEMNLNFSTNVASCPACDSSCYNNSCWGPGPENCQKLTKLICAQQCPGRCRGRELNDCCHVQCAAGCRGPRDHDCLSCRMFKDEDTCKESCPPLMIYNYQTFQLDDNPGGKYSFGATCVKACPYNYVDHNGSCVRTRGPEQNEVHENNIRKCKKCNGPCPKDCNGIGMGSLLGVLSINASNIDTFENCTKVNGDIIILQTTFTGDMHTNTLPLQLHKLNVFKVLKEITGFLMIVYWPANFTDLSIFENLEIIRGRTQHLCYSLAISNVNISSLGLRSLREISDGDVSISRNKNLCYADTLPWNKIVKHSRQNMKLMNNSTPQLCNRNNQVCHPQCSDGCWGPGSSQCLSCLNVTRGKECVEQCNILHGEPREFEKDGRCLPCDPECLPQNGTKTCNGPDSGNCTKCAHYKDGPHCVSSCPAGIMGENNIQIWKHADEHNVCHLCHPNCTQGCTGPGLESCEHTG
ncbi:epidermal growth factor receptor-like [Protopterus annectens]|uniref:epidermal growth factor receptor-like n=1 Tax=Protopterus annectens TaxID=7888 RepID=UPI001CF9CC76|nr:epidermal growth factor receptor-like [Protopterus annectens]